MNTPRNAGIGGAQHGYIKCFFSGNTGFSPYGKPLVTGILPLTVLPPKKFYHNDITTYEASFRVSKAVYQPLQPAMEPDWICEFTSAGLTSLMVPSQI